jgi:hypothetical protein
MATANPPGLVVGGGVTIAGVSTTVSAQFANFGYNGGFVVTSIPTSKTFTVHNRFNLSTGGTGGTARANTMGERRATVPTLFFTGTLKGDTILPGGVQVEAGNFATGACVPTTQLKQAALQETDLMDGDGVFSSTGALNQAREGFGGGVLGGPSAHAGDLIVIGGACTTTTPSLQSFTIGSSATSACNNTGGSGSALNDYSEIFNGSTWAVGPGPAGGAGCSPPSSTCFQPTNAAGSAVLP